MKDILCPDEDKLEDSTFEFLFDIYHQDATNLEIFIFHVVTTYINEGIAGLYTNLQKYYTVHEHAEISKNHSFAEDLAKTINLMFIRRFGLQSNRGLNCELCFANMDRKGRRNTDIQGLFRA